MAKSAQKKISPLGALGALEALVGTQMYRESAQRDLQEEADSLIEQLRACSTILNNQGRRANDSKEIAGNLLHGVACVLYELAERVEQAKRTIELLAKEPKVIVPEATVKFNPRTTTPRN